VHVLDREALVILAQLAQLGDRADLALDVDAGEAPASSSRPRSLALSSLRRRRIASGVFDSGIVNAASGPPFGFGRCTVSSSKSTWSNVMVRTSSCRRPVESVSMRPRARARRSTRAVVARRTPNFTLMRSPVPAIRPRTMNVLLPVLPTTTPNPVTSLFQ
jgi:hypothetical protein